MLFSCGWFNLSWFGWGWTDMAVALDWFSLAVAGSGLVIGGWDWFGDCCSTRH